jgi:glutaredoxin-like YruB-family protein
MRSLALVMALWLLILGAWPLWAETYKYTDAKGDLHFVDELSKVPKRYRAKARTMDDLPAINVMEAPPAAPARSARPAASPQKERFRGTVELYVTSWCRYCKKAERYLQDKGIAYQAYDIEKDDQARRHYESLGGGGVPLIVIGSNKLSGFSPEAIDHFTGR